MSGDVLENLSRRMVSLVRFFDSKEMNREGIRSESVIRLIHEVPPRKEKIQRS
jgi:hypothetical protein